MRTTASSLLIALSVTSSAADIGRAEQKSTIPLAMQRLLLAYPEHIVNAEANTIIWRDGTKMEWSDGEKKNEQRMLEKPTLEYMFQEEYPTHFGDREQNNGRSRYDPFFQKMYGANKKEVGAHLHKLQWMPKTVNKTIYVTSINDIDKKLKAVSDELDKLPLKIRQCAAIAESFNYRNIFGSTSTSSHGYGIAIDVGGGKKYGDYWAWNKKGPEGYRNRIPQQIVEVFEKHGFIWGGKWYRFDTMHFEYRPELLVRLPKEEMPSPQENLFKQMKRMLSTPLDWSSNAMQQTTIPTYNFFKTPTTFSVTIRK